MIDLFCGAGGLSLGFSAKFGNPFISVWANDFNEFAAKTYNANFGDHCVVGDVSCLLQNPEISIPKADVVVGGPPCQGFSLLNKNRTSDNRKELWRPFLEVVERCGAEVFVMENVPQLLGSFEHGEIVGIAEKMGFTVVAAKLCAADYGVPQIRYRAFLVGCKFADPGLVFPPKKTHYNTKNGNHQAANGYIDNPSPWRTLRDVIADLPGPEVPALDPSRHLLTSTFWALATPY